MATPPNALVLKIRHALAEAANAAWDVADYHGYPTPYKRPTNGRYTDPDAALEGILNGTYRDLRMLAEHMGQSECLTDITDFEHDNSEKFGDVHFDPDSDDHIAVGLEEAREFLNSLLAVADYPVRTGIETAFRNILFATAKIVHNSHAKPTNERQVRDPVFDVLSYVFADITRIGVVAHPGKAYLPDFTSKSAASIAEFKFVKDKAGLPKAYDEISADMAGYSGEPAIRYKYAVLYLAASFATQAEVDAHFGSVGKPDDWEIIVVHGTGGAIVSAPTR